MSAQAQGRDVIVIGGSAGAVEATRAIVRGLPADLPAAVAAVVHHNERTPSVFGHLLQRMNVIPVVTVEREHLLERGRIYVPPSDHHLLVERERVVASRGPKENRARPAIDPLFRSAASAHRSRVIGVVLTGTLDDGSAGLAAIKRAGGVAIVQDPADAMFGDMPRNAMRATQPDFKVPLSEIPHLLAALARGEVMPRTVSDESETENLPTTAAAQTDAAWPGEQTVFTCPTCHGALREAEEGRQLSFNCHTGHRFGVDTLMDSQAEDVELALWSAVRSLQERIFLLDRLEQKAKAQASALMEERHAQERARLEHHVATLRKLLEAAMTPLARASVN